VSTRARSIKLPKDLASGETLSIGSNPEESTQRRGYRKVKRRKEACGGYGKDTVQQEGEGRPGNSTLAIHRGE